MRADSPLRLIPVKTIGTHGTIELNLCLCLRRMMAGLKAALRSTPGLFFINVPVFNIVTHNRFETVACRWSLTAFGGATTL